MNIYLQELKIYWKSWLVWTVALITLASFFLSIFPTFSENALSMKQLLQGFPETLRKAVGLSIEGIASFKGFYNYILPEIMLCSSIQAMILGASIFSKENREKTAEFLLSKPISRGSIAASKTLAALTALLATNIIYIPTILAVASAANKESIDIKSFVLVSLTLLFMQLIFASIGLFISILNPRMKAILPISLGTVFGFFFLNVIYRLFENDLIRLISPFSYFDLNYINANNGYQTNYLIISLAVPVVLTLLSHLIYKRKDIIQ